MKHISKFFLLLFLTIILTSCAPKAIDRTDPSQTVIGFTNAIKSYDFETIGSYLTEIPDTTKQGLLIDIYTDENYLDLYKKSAKKSSYTITSVEQTEQGASVTVTAKSYDLKTGYSSALLSLAAKVMEDEELMQEMLDKNADVTHYIPETIQELIDQGSIKTDEKTIKITLVKDQSQNYQVHLDDAAKTLITSGISDAVSGITGNLGQ